MADTIRADQQEPQGFERSLGRLTSGFSIRFLLLTAIGFLSLLLLTALGLQAAGAWVAYRTAAQYAVLNEATNLYVTGLQELAKERLLTNNALQTDATATTETMTAIAAARGRSDTLLADSLVRIAVLQEAELHESQFKAARDNLAKLPKLRADVDKALALP